MEKIAIENYSLVTGRKPKREDVEADKSLLAKALEIVKSNKLPEGVVAVIEACHASVPTLKYIAYSHESLKNSVETYVKPMWKPVKHNHKTLNPMSMTHDVNELPLGRVVAAEFRERRQTTPLGRATGAVYVAAYIPKTAKLSDGTFVIDALASRQIINVSIGASGDKNTVRCSICGKNPIVPNDKGEYECNHNRGTMYDGKLCFYTLDIKEFEEISLVTDPADTGAYIPMIGLSDSRESSESEFSQLIHTVDSGVNTLCIYDTEGNIYDRGLEKARKDDASMTYDNQSANNTKLPEHEVILTMNKLVEKLTEEVVELSSKLANIGASETVTSDDSTSGAAPSEAPDSEEPATEEDTMTVENSLPAPSESTTAESAGEENSETPVTSSDTVTPESTTTQGSVTTDNATTRKHIYSPRRVPQTASATKKPSVAFKLS